MPAKVLILNPPSPDASYINRDLMGGMGVHNAPPGRDIRAKIIFRIKSIVIHIPMTHLVNAATVLKQRGHELKIIDAINTGEGIEHVLKEAKAFGPQFVLMGVSSGCFKFERDDVARRLKEEIPGVKVIAAGDMITEMPQELLPYFDFAVMGEVEQSVPLIVEGVPYKEIQSIIWQENNEVRKSEGGKRFIPVEELEKLPFPDWGLWPYKHYSYYPMLTKTPVVLIQASRGCPYGCGYCPYPANQGRLWRARSAESVFEEIKWDVEKFGIKAVFFRDPLFTANQERAEKLCDLIIQSGIKIQFCFETRPELLSKPGLIEKLAKAGCRTINFGVEDIHPEILKKINRLPLPLDKILDTIHRCEKAGIRTSCFFILGLPGSTKQTMEETIEFSRKLFGSQTEYKIATPFPGTMLYKMAKENKWLTSEGFDKLGSYSASMRISGEFDEHYLERLSEKSFVDYYFSPRYLVRYFMRGDFLTTLQTIIKAKLRGDF
ncbi:radical SAM protein [Candidatus Woesearchaeota archaeon]|nr:radical SAM protein [Candidatus Woesearchaeota archaeon]